MIGIDRPIRPRWIYETLKNLKPGERPTIFNEVFENIARELIGKEGKRKIRTIIFRSFIYSLQKEKNIIKPNEFIYWAESEDIKKLEPLFLMKILMDYEITRFIVRKTAVSIDNSNQVSVPLLSKLMVKEFGDRDIVKRSLRAFLTTLVHFKILRQTDINNYILNKKKALSNEQVRKFIILYSKYYICSKIINIKEIEPEFFFFFKPVDLTAVGNEFNSRDWEFIREIDRNMLILKY
ncbi:hypothetical protein QUF70_01555 [Desulfobacterales bacterium HSG17]|nr:hypothetical protein [Desulfobacterales bacterium HSG17]